MRKKVLLVLACCGALLAVGSQAAAAGDDGTTVCDQNTQTFSGTTANLIVKSGGYCAIDNATITGNLVVQNGASTDVTNSSIGYDETIDGGGNDTLTNSTVGHDVKVQWESQLVARSATIRNDLIATHAGSIQIVRTGGQTTVGHDVVVNGSPGSLTHSGDAFTFDSLCNLSVGHDLVVENRWVTLGFTIGECFGAPESTVGHDLVVTNDQALSTGFAGPSSLNVGRIQVGNDATFSGNTAAPGGSLQFEGNTIAGNATCSKNTPAVTADAPNIVGGTNNGCP
jgi:hypothetical protein